MGLFDRFKKGETEATPGVIEWANPGPEDLVYRWPDSNIPTMSVVVVRPGQAAVFVRDGKIYGVLQEGRHVLSTMNIPFLKDLIGAAPVPGAKAAANMFKAEIYFVSVTEHQGRFGGKAYAGNRFPIQYSGTYRYKIEKPEVFLKELVGAGGSIDTAYISDFLRSTIQSRLIKFIGDLPPSDFTEVLQVQNKAKAFLTTQFEQLGLKLIDLNFAQFTLSPEFEKILPYLSTAQSWDQLFRVLQMQTLQEMSKNMGGSPAGVGVGLGMGMMMPYMMGAPPSPTQAQPATGVGVGVGGAQGQQTKKCPNCGAVVPANAKFCPYCGYKFPEQQSQQTKKCPNCGATVPANAKFCPYCGYKFP